MEDIIEKTEEILGINQEAETPVEPEITTEEVPTVEEEVEAQEERIMCANCEGKGTVNEGHKICPVCNGNCFA